MAERPPSRPRVAWQENSSPLECYEVSMVQPLQTGKTLPEESPEHPELQPGWDSESTWLLSSLDSSNVTKVFGEYLQPPQRTDIILVAIEALTADDIYDRQMGSNILDMAMRDPASWLMDVPKIMTYIHKNMECICTEPARRSLDSLLLLLTNRYTREVGRSLLKISPTCGSAALAMLEVMFSMPGPLRRVLNEMLHMLQDRQLRRVFSSAVEDACIYPLALLAHINTDAEEFADMYKVCRFLRHPSMVVLSLMLRGLVTLSEEPKTAREMQVLLPDIMETLQDANADVKMKALAVLRNVLGVMKRHEASPIALKLSEELLHLFDDESSQVQQLSISLFRDVINMVVRNSRRQIKKIVRKSLIPLFFHMNDQIESVAKASRDTLLACAEFLGWRRLSYLARTCQTHRIGECLLLQDKTRAEKYLHQSLPYLKDAQSTLREAAIRFIGLAAQHLRNRRKEKLWDICNTLQPLAKDTELSVCSLATQTIFILTSLREKPTSRWSLRSLCCWPCWALEK